MVAAKSKMFNASQKLLRASVKPIFSQLHDHPKSASGNMLCLALKETVHLRKIRIFYLVLNRILAKTDQNAK